MKNVINFYCLHCKVDFNFNVGEVRFLLEENVPTFEHNVKCPTCGAEYFKEKDNFSLHFELTELGQTQLSELYFDS